MSEFHANTFEEMGELSKKHGMEMHQKKDAAHIESMSEMGQLMNNPSDMEKWFESKRKEFESLPQNQA
ncbi:MAG: DUF1059 domain-containing protein [Halieaceae bacterium]|jgi:hypothetical protein|nr:DUF1059 domain-containing protein [Halieaceae bacterium]